MLLQDFAANERGASCPGLEQCLGRVAKATRLLSGRVQPGARPRLLPQDAQSASYRQNCFLVIADRQKSESRSMDNPRHAWQCRRETRALTDYTRQVRSRVPVLRVECGSRSLAPRLNIRFAERRWLGRRGLAGEYQDLLPKDQSRGFFLLQLAPSRRRRHPRLAHPDRPGADRADRYGPSADVAETFLLRLECAPDGCPCGNLGPSQKSKFGPIVA
jgi:hypothetical protein